MRPLDSARGKPLDSARGRPLDFARGGYVAATLSYALITVAIFHNLLPVISTHVYSDTGDALLNASILAWNATHLPLSGGWWNYPSFAPLSGITAWTEHLLGAYPLTTPIVRITGNAVLAYNVLLLTCFPLNGLATFALAREVTGSAAAAFVAGLAFAFAPYQSGQVAHVQMLMAFGMPLALLGLHQYVEHGRRRGAAWFTIGWLSVVASNAYMLVFFPILVALWCVWCARGPQGSAPHVDNPVSSAPHVDNPVSSGAGLSALDHARDDPELVEGSGPRVTRLVPIAIAAALVTMVVAPLLWGYHVRQAAYALARHYDEIRSFGADLRSLAGIPHQEWLWSSWLDTTSIEASLFPGVAILALTAIGMAPRLRGAWRRRDPAVFYLAGAIAMWLIAIGPEPAWAGTRVFQYGPYRLLLLLPGGTSIRVPARAWLPAALCLAVTAGAGAAALIQRPRRRWMAVAFAVMIAAEGWFHDAVFEVPRGPSNEWIPRGALVLDLPIGASAENVPAEYLAVTHGYRVVNGYSGYAPPHFAALRGALASHQPTAFDSFRRLDDLYVIVRPAVDAPFIRWMESQPGIERAVDTPEWGLYRLPRIGEGAPTTMPVPLPRPGAVAFQLR